MPIVPEFVIVSQNFILEERDEDVSRSGPGPDQNLIVTVFNSLCL